MKIITTIIIFLQLVICENASAASAYSWLSWSSRGISQTADYTSWSVQGGPSINEYSRFNSTWGDLTGVTIFTEIHGDFFVSELLPTGLNDFSTPLTVVGLFSAGNLYSEYNESFNISGVGNVRYNINQEMINIIPESDWAEFIHFPNTPPAGVSSWGSHHSTLNIDIISQKYNAKRFVGMTVREDTKVKYDYDEAPLAAGIPEPESYALMLVGLSALGFVARRRKTR